MFVGFQYMEQKKKTEIFLISLFSHQVCLVWTELNETSASLPDFNVPNQVQTGTSGGESFFQCQQVKTHFYSLQLF